MVGFDGLGWGKEAIKVLSDPWTSGFLLSQALALVSLHSPCSDAAIHSLGLQTTQVGTKRSAFSVSAENMSSRTGIAMVDLVYYALEVER